MADVKVGGLEKFADLIEEKLVNTEKNVAIMKKICALVEGEAKRNAPKGAGDLRRSIDSKVEVEGKAVIGIVFTPLEYAPYVEYGTGLFAEGGNGRKNVPWVYQDDEGEWHSTSGMHPHPYMRPALLDNRDKIKKIIKEGILND